MPRLESTAHRDGYPRARTPRPVPALALACACLLALCLAGPAGAATSSFGAEGHGAGEFEEPAGIAISQEAGEVFIGDRNNERIDAFAASGPFLRAFGWGVASDKEELQTCTSSCFLGYEGPGAGELSAPAGVAVDNDPLSASHGDVYVIDARNNRVQKLTASGAFLLMFGREVNATGKGDICDAGEACQAGVEVPEGTVAGPGELSRLNGLSIAVDSAGDVYVGDENRIQRFSPAGVVEPAAQISLPGSGFIEDVAVDSTGDVYVKSSGLPGVRKYNPAGEELQSPRDEAGSPGALALNAAGELFVEDSSEGPHILKFNPTGVKLQSFPAEGQYLTGIAFDEAGNAIYSLSRTEIHPGSVAAVNVTPVPVQGPLVISENTETVGPTSATLTAIVNPEGPQGTTGTASYHFEYGPTAAYGHSTTTTTLAGGPFEDQGASAPIAGLEAGKTYHFRVVVTNGAGETSFGPDQTVTTLPPVTIDQESASKVTAFSARLEGELNPHGSATEYHFEYGLTAAYGTSVPLSDASAGEGAEDTVVAVPIQNLDPGTTYHYRLVAHNSLGTVTGPDQSFETQGASDTALIDGRAWEQVTPLQKQGATIEAISEEGDAIQAAANGDALTYGALSPITAEPQGNRSPAYSQLLATRTSPGTWSTQDISAKNEELASMPVGEQAEYRLFSTDLTSAFIQPPGATPLSPDATEPTPYRREANGTFTPLLTTADVQPGVKFGGEQEEVGGTIVPGLYRYGPQLWDATPDGSHVLVSSPQPLTDGVEYVSQTVNNLYEWSNGALRLASVLPNKEPASTEGGVAERRQVLPRHELSDSGERIVFSVPQTGAGALDLRDMGLEQTVQLDKPEPGLRKEGGEATFEIANASDSRVFFLQTARLTARATARQGQPDLYECEVTTTAGVLGCALKDLTVDATAGESANVLGVLGADEAGSLIYFVANGKLASGAVAGDCALNEQQSNGTSCNLYVQNTETGAVRLVAVVSGADFYDWAQQFHGGLGTLTSRVALNGEYLAFMSERPLTGFDNRDAKSGQLDEEVFEYSYAGNTLTCVSCASTGARPEGIFAPGAYPNLLVDRTDGLWLKRWLAASIPGWTSVSREVAFNQSRYLSNSGRLFFDSATPLVPADGNGVEDVYEFEPTGAGCQLASGCVGLISSGSSSEESAFLDASEDGSDVFFLTSAQLTKADTDNAYDIYDAHVCSSEAPCAPEAATPPSSCGTADSCRAASTPQPDIAAAPASQTFSGSGNITPASKPPVKTKTLTRAQKLAKALAACDKDKNKKKKAACVKRARKLYGPAQKKKKAKKGKKRG